MTLIKDKPKWSAFLGLCFVFFLGFSACGGNADSLREDGGVDLGGGTDDPTAPDDGEVPPDDPPEETDDPPPVTSAPAAFTLTPEAENDLYDLGEIEYKSAQTPSFTLTNNTSADATVSIYIAPEDGHTEGTVSLTGADGKATLAYTATVATQGTLEIPLSVPADRTGVIRGKLIVSIPEADQAFEIFLRGRIIADVLRLLSPLPKTYLKDEASVHVAGELTGQGSQFPDTVAVTLALTQGETAVSSASAAVKKGRFEADVGIPTTSGRYTLTASASDGTTTYTETRTIIREGSFAIELSLVDKTGKAIDPILTDADPLELRVKVATIDADAGHVTAAVKLFAPTIGDGAGPFVELEPKGLIPDSGRDYIAFTLPSAKRLAVGINRIEVAAANRVAETSGTTEFFFDAREPNLLFAQPLHRGTVEALAQDGDTLTIRGEATKMERILTAIHAQAAGLSLTPPDSPVCRKEAPTKLEINVTTPLGDTVRTVDPCPLRLYINGSGDYLRILPGPLGAFSFGLDAEQAGPDGITQAGYRFGTNLFRFQATDDLGHKRAQSLSFQAGKVAYTEYDAATESLILPPVEEMLGLSVNRPFLENPTLHDSVEHALNDPEDGYRLGDYLSDMTEGMRDCLAAIKTPLYLGQYGDTGYADYRGQNLSRCVVLENILQEAEATWEACLATEGCEDNPEIGIKASWPNLFIFADDRIKSNFDRRYFRAVSNGTTMSGNDVKRGTWVIKKLTMTEGGKLDLAIDIEDVYGEFLLLSWDSSDDWNSLGLPSTWPLRFNMDKISITTQLEFTEDGRIFVRNGDIQWIPDTKKCNDGIYHRESTRAFGCGNGHKGFLIDAATEYGEDVFRGLGGLKKDKYDELIEDQNYEELDYIGQLYTQAMSDILDRSFKELLCHKDYIYDNSEDWCEVTGLDLVGSLSEAERDDSAFQLKLAQLIFDATKDGLGILARPQFVVAANDLTPTEAFAAGHIPMVYRAPQVPAIPSIPDEPGLGLLLNEQVLNQALQIAIMNGLDSEAEGLAKYEMHLNNKSLVCDMGVGTDLIEITTGLLLSDENSEPAELVLRIPPTYAPTLTFDDDGFLSVGWGGIDLDVYPEGQDGDPSALLATMGLDLLLRYSVLPIEGENLLDLELKLEKGSLLALSVLENHTDKAYGNQISGNLEQVLAQALSTMAGCYHIGIPADITSGELVFEACLAEETDPEAETAAAAAFAALQEEYGCPATEAPADDAGEEEDGDIWDLLNLDGLEIESPELDWSLGYFGVGTEVILHGK